MKFTLILGTAGYAVVGLGIAEASLLAVQVSGGGLDATVRTWWPVILTAGMGLMGYARLTERQKTYETSHKEQLDTNKKLTDKMDDVGTRLARIEGRLFHKDDSHA